jgi:predicted protein tyrosine phosphatase
MTHVPFVCSQDKLRSPAAAQVFKGCPGIETDSAGTNRGATVELCEERVLWADVVFVMVPAHRQKLQRNFKKQLKHQRVVCLNIPDDFAFIDPTLVSLFERKAPPIWNGWRNLCSGSERATQVAEFMKCKIFTKPEQD